MTPSYSAHSLPLQNQAWHTHSVEQTLALLETNPETGLTEAEVRQRQAHYGSNELAEVAGRTNWDILLDQFKNVMLLMLIAVAIISGILDIVALRTSGMTKEGIPFKDTIAIIVIVILNGFLGYFQESRAEKALSALKRLSSPKVQVLRQGDRREIEAIHLVPGDIILIEAGTQLSADGQIIEAANLQVRESALTGEAHAVEKQAVAADLDPDIALGDRVNMVFTGTEVLQGRAKVVVTRTGMETELGKIAQMLQSVQNEATPLQQRMTQLGNVLVMGSMILVLVVVVGGVLRSGWGMLQDLIEISLSMAVAVVPEGLPAVITVTLAIGTQRMIRRHALIRKLPAVETLGSVDVICSDKTGTLTQNKMIVQEIITLEHHYQVKGDGYEPQGEFQDEQQQSIAPETELPLSTLLLSAMLCNDAHLTFADNQWSIIGDPTEGSLLVLGGKAGIDQASLKQEWQRLAEIPFSSERKRMSVACCRLDRKSNLAHDIILWSKGSPELLLEQCRYYQANNESIPLTQELRQQIAQANDGLAGRGLRVLGFAYKALDAHWQEPLLPSHEQDLVWLGLVGMLDAPRAEVKVAVDKCRSAGIRPIMITGDHQLTAQIIAQKLGISQVGDRVLTGKELEIMTQETLEQEVEAVTVYARVSPEHKLRIVQALQKKGKFVAMTGDGVNDAPAIKQANIGIAMGITGTDVSKEASDMVLLDDNFATIVAATEEGRVVYSNIRHFIKYILGSNIGEVITIAAAPILGLSGIPLTPLQILWMNLVTDGLPALALAVEPADPDVMSYPPFSPKESIFARGLGAYIIRIGLVFAIISISLMVWAFNESRDSGNPNSWKTMVFTTLCLAQMGHAIAVRSNHQLTIEMNPMTNPYLWGAVVVTTILQLMLIYVAPLRDFFDTELLTPRQLLICLGISTLMFVWVEMEKIVGRIYRRFRRTPFS